MIDASKLLAEDCGRWVTYTDGVGEQEHGILKGFNNQYVFVVFHCDGQWKDFNNYTGNSCDGKDVTFMYPDEAPKNALSKVRTMEQHRTDCDKCERHRTVYFNEHNNVRQCHHCGAIETDNN